MNQLEIERKWLADKSICQFMDMDNLFAITQTYFSADSRLRITHNPDGSSIATMTIKQHKSVLTCKEFEYDIPTDEALEIIEGRPHITKYRSADTEGLGYTIDEFQGDMAGLFLVEKEFDTELAALKEQIPNWQMIEVTGNVRFNNNMLQGMTWDDQLGLHRSDTGVIPGGVIMTGDEDDIMPRALIIP